MGASEERARALGSPVEPSGRRPSRSAATALAGFALAVLLGCSSDSGGGRVLVLGLDGLDPRAVDLLVSEQKLPNFARLRSEGAYGRLRSQRPLLSPVIWTTVATGKTPDQHGIGHFVAVDQRTGEEIPATSTMRRVKALWNIASEAGRTVAVVGWWATWPPEAVNGWVVSDHTAYHFLFSEGLEDEPADADTTFPPGLRDEIAPWVQRPQDIGAGDLAEFATVDAGELDRPFRFEDDLAHLRWALATADTYRDVGLHLWRGKEPDLELVYIEATDSASHLFGHLFRAEGLAGELAEQQARYGGTVEAMYRYADRIVGDFLDAADSDTTVVVLSDHGFELGRLHDDPTQTRDLRRVSERFHTEDGILYLWGRGIQSGVRLERASILDVAPTLLALLGLPRAADMPGRVLVEALADVAVPDVVASYEPDAAEETATEPGRDARTDAALTARLRSLGYLGGANGGARSGDGDDTRSPQGERNLAAVHFDRGEYVEAETIYRRLMAEAPEDGSLRTSLAGVLGAQGRYDEADGELLRALELSPMDAGVHHNLGAIAERRGKGQEAVERYRTALTLDPGYEPSRQAMVRLTGTAEIRAPRGEEERGAAALADEASLAARRADYARALELLDRAEALAPDLLLIQQYRSNVAYLMGDRAAALRALRRGLELEPDNVLLRENLKRLEREAPAAANPP